MMHAKPLAFIVVETCQVLKNLTGLIICRELSETGKRPYNRCHHPWIDDM